jgi:hypothetical protein
MIKADEEPSDEFTQCSGHDRAMLKALAHIAIAIVVLTIGSCMFLRLVYRYSGDGTLTDNGMFEAGSRYVLDLGPIELDRTTVSSFVIEGLPVENFVVGLELRNTAGTPVEQGSRTTKPIVKMELRAPDGQVIFGVRSSLEKWVWNTDRYDRSAFVYVRDPDTSFMVPRVGKYKLTLEVVQAGDPTYSSRLIAKSGGWK